MWSTRWPSGSRLTWQRCERIADPAAIEEADTRGLVTLEPVGAQRPGTGGASALRRGAPPARTAPPGCDDYADCVAAELADARCRDDIRVVVRRAALSIDSDLAPDTELLDPGGPRCGMAGRSAARRSTRRGGESAPEPGRNRIRSRPRTFVAGPRARRPTRCSPASRPTELTDGRPGPTRVPAGQQHAVGARLIPSARSRSSTTRRAPRAAGTQLHRRLPHGVLVCDGSARGRNAGVEESGLESLPAVVGAEIAWVLAVIAADAGRTAEAVSPRGSGIRVRRAFLDAPHMRFNIADAHLSALLLAGRVTDAVEVAERVRQQAADLPGAAQLLGPRWRVGPPLGAGHLGRRACCWSRRQTACPPRAMPSAGDTATACPTSTVLAMRGCADEAAAALAVSTAYRGRSGRWTTSGAWPGHGWPPPRVRSVRRSAFAGGGRKGPGQ